MDGNLENNFREFRHGDDITRLRWLLGPTMALSALFAVQDYLLLTEPRAILSVLLARILGLVPAVFTVLVARKNHPPARTYRRMFVSAVAFMASVLYISTQFPAQPIGSAVASAMVLVTYTIVPMLSWQRIAANTAFSIGVIGLLVPHYDPAEQLPTIVLILMVNVLGFVSERSTGNARRREYLQLRKMLPQSAILRMKSGERVADEYPSVSILFADLVGFTAFARDLNPREMVDTLDTWFGAMDELCDRYSIEKIKTIGDGYMAAAGAPDPHADHASDLVRLAMAMLTETAGASKGNLRLRIGIHSGPVFAGVIGEKKQAYDLWGDTVNVASRMESQGLEGCIQLSQTTYELLNESLKQRCEPRGEIQLKGHAVMKSYLIRVADSP